jgi:hypothetical protein
MKQINIINEGLKFGLICGLTAVLFMFGSWALGIKTFTAVQFYSTFVGATITFARFFRAYRRAKTFAPLLSPNCLVGILDCFFSR